MYNNNNLNDHSNMFHSSIGETYEEVIGSNGDLSEITSPIDALNQMSCLLEESVDLVAKTTASILCLLLEQLENTSLSQSLLIGRGSLISSRSISRG